MFSHTPVLLREVISSLNIKADGTYVDATFGGGGHSIKILENLNKGLLIGIDQDIDAINNAKEKYQNYIDNGKLILVKDNFENIDKILDELNINNIDGILYDLGVSSHQFDEADRGFSYRFDAKLDMRMDKSNSFSCYDLINEYSENEIFNIIRDLGEEKFAKNIARNIVKERKNKKINTTFELVDIIKNSIPNKFRWGDGNEKNPAKRTFQALRIYINREFEVLDASLEKAVDRLKDSGRIEVLSFNSLEDRIVKEKFKKFESPCTCPKNYPCVCGKKSKGIVITKKVILAGVEELKNNRRAKPAKLRIFERRKT